MDNHRLINQSSGATSYGTPLPIIEAARSVMGGIELDPASAAWANERIGAKRYYTAEDDGLSYPWIAKTWVNEKGACKCKCHSGHASVAELRIHNHLNISTLMGSLSEHPVLVAGESSTDRGQSRNEKLKQHAVDAESISRFIGIVVAGSVSISGSEKEKILFYLQTLELSGFAENVSRLSQQRLNTSTGRAHRGTDYQAGAGIVTGSMPEKVQESNVPRAKVLMPIESLKSSTECPMEGKTTSAAGLLSTTRAGEIGLTEPPYGGVYPIGINASATGITGVLTVESQDFLHRIISFLYHLRIALELSEETLCQLANLATTLKEVSLLLNGAKTKMPWTLSCSTSRVCSNCNSCCCIEYPGTVFLNHPFGPDNRKWIQKLVQDFKADYFDQACCITYACTSEAWFRPLQSYPQCYLSPRTNYHLPDGTLTKGVPKGSVVTYLGPNVGRFYRVFERERGLGKVQFPASMFDGLIG